MPLTSNPLSLSTVQLFDALRDALVRREPIRAEGCVASLFQASDLPKSLWGCAVALYQPATPRILVVRVMQATAFENVRAAINQVMRHDRFDEFTIRDANRCRMQVDLIMDEPDPVALSELSDAVLPDGNLINEQQVFNGIDAAPPWQVQVISTWSEDTPRKLTRFEMGVDGLRIVTEAKRRYFLPGDAFVHSILGIGQLRRHIQRLFPGVPIDQLTYSRFRSLSFVSGTEPGSWLPLYRGLPPVPDVNEASLGRAASAGAKWIADNLRADGRFMYYYDAATDTGRDHEHPTRNWKTDPYYNLLRHGGGVITLLLEEQLRQAQGGRTSCSADHVSEGKQHRGAGLPLHVSDQRRRVIEQANDFLVRQLVDYQTSDDRPAAYALYNQKAKLGGSGVSLYSLALYQRLFHDDRYADAAQRLALHLVSEINQQGEFRYYHIYLGQPVGWEDNQRYFSFYYPGEAILGLSQYCQHVCRSADERHEIYAKMHLALRFLLRDRPRLHAPHYKSLPADSWLMMGLTDLWSVAEFRRDEYQQFVFDDADQMVRLMYTEANALYPDYVGSFYYHYGDHPYPDGARAEGLLAAYQLALTVGDRQRSKRYREACVKVAAATFRLCNTPESMYSAANPERAIGGIRFKLTRQWFRVDTIQHVASFYLKLLLTEIHCRRG